MLFAWPAAQRAIAPCWPRHWDVIEELSMLYCAWRTAYLWQERSGHHACEYLDRWPPGALDRLAVRLRPCAEAHQPDGARRDDAELVDRSIAELRRLGPDTLAPGGGAGPCSAVTVCRACAGPCRPP
ncbi:hypothetical protein [Nonomuraea sp. NPDC049709]|uniref:hypothetical protein n=1 Tax=Nonomuraea sp. NPDC049709 TaxID=3154736 RepID=UPI00343C086A